MGLRAFPARSPTGLEYLDAVTALLQRRRLAEPEREMCEAADLQWWWPRHPHEDPADARFWYDGEVPIAGVVFTPWTSDHVACEVFADAGFRPAWTFAAERTAQLGASRVEIEFVPETDLDTQAAARSIGYVPAQESYAASWLAPAARRAPTRPLPAGYRIVRRADDPGRPHPMITRNGAGIEDGLRRCSLYDRSLDLAMIAPDGAVAGYALFWPDPVTGVGLVEPMRVEDEHAGQGLATHLLATGLDGLTGRGCTRLKVIHEPTNTHAHTLYLSAGFTETVRGRTWLAGPRSASSL